MECCLKEKAFFPRKLCSNSRYFPCFEITLSNLILSYIYLKLWAQICFDPTSVWFQNFQTCIRSILCKNKLNQSIHSFVHVWFRTSILKRNLFRLLGNISEFLKFEIVNQFLHIGKIQLLSKDGLFNFFGRLEIKSLM